MCGLFWGAHKSLAPRARTLLGGLGQATLSFFAVATLWFVFFGECPNFCELAKQRRKIVGGVSEVGKDDFSLYFFWRCVIFLVFFFLLQRSRDGNFIHTLRFFLWWWMRWSWWWRVWSRRRRRGLWETAEGPGLRGQAYDAGSCK